MKSLGALAVCLGLLAGSVVAAPPAAAGNLDIQGATISWDDATFYAPTGCSRFIFNWTNNTGRELLQLKMVVSSRFGDTIAFDSKIGIDSGTSGSFDEQICASELTDGLGPYNVTLRVEDFTSLGGGAWETTAPLTFLSRTPAAPTAQAPVAKSVKCINKKTFKKRVFKGVTKCPKGWVRI